MTRIEIWLKGLIAAAISGGAGGVLTGFAAAAALINAVIGVAAYLQKSLPEG